MIRFDCPSCGKRIKVDDSKVGVTGNCPKCGAQATVPNPIPVASHILPFIGGISITLAYAGFVALWIWSLSLLYDHWGFFWALIGFAVFPFCLVVLIMGFFWGVWYFILGFLACATFGVTASAANDNGARPTFLCALTALVFLGCFSFFAWQDAVTIEPLTDARKALLVEDALAVSSLMVADRTDPEVVVKLSMVIEEFKTRLDGYDENELAEVERIVNAYWLLTNSMFRDLIAVASGTTDEFGMSEQTKAIYKSLPQRLQIVADGDYSSIEKVSKAFVRLGKQKIPADRLDSATAIWEQKQRLAASVYEQLFDHKPPPGTFD